jgi:hypothetical protein
MAQNEILDAQQLIDKKAQVRRARIIALALSGATFISIIFFVFAFIQKAQADQARIEVEQLKVEVLKHAEVARASKMEADLQRQLASALGAELDNCKHSK